MQFAFGSGVFWGTPLTDASGNAITNPTPVQLGVLQNVSVDISFDVKELYGQNQFAVAVGRGKGKLTGKAASAQLSAAAINSLVFGQTLTPGLTNDYYDVLGQSIPASPSTVTIVAPGAGTFAYDLGVRNANGVPMTRVSGTPTTGQYSLATGGVYTFATADAGNTVFISYQYTATSTVAQHSTVKNVLMGQAPMFKADIYVPYGGKSLVLTLPQAMSTKFTLATKLDDFMIPDFDFSGFSDPSGNVLIWGTSE